MAQVTTRKVVEGLNNLVLHAYFESDGFEGELNNFVLLAPDQLDPPLKGLPTFRIVQMWYDINFNMTLKYNALVPVPVWVLSSGFPKHFDFSRFGGVTDFGGTPDSDGKLLVSTNGFTTIGTNGSLVIEFRKP